MLLVAPWVLALLALLLGIALPQIDLVYASIGLVLLGLPLGVLGVLLVLRAPRR